MLACLCVSALLPGYALAQPGGLPGAPQSQILIQPSGTVANPAMGLTLLEVLQAALSRNPQLVIQQYNVEAQAGVLLTTRGQFDWVIDVNGNQQKMYTPLTAANILAYYPPGSGIPAVSATNANTSTVSASATKQLRDGITLSPSVSATRLTDNIGNRTGLSEAQVGLQIDLPLLRNRGRATVDALEISARKQLEATRMDLSQMVSDTLATAVTRYWTFVAADATLAEYKASEARGQSLLNGTESLVAADRLPANDLNQTRANLADRTASRTQAEQNLLQARQQLVLVMGLEAEKIVSIPAPAEDIPAVVPAFDDSLLTVYLQMANTRRADVLAGRLRVESNEALQRAAENQLKPQLNIQGQAGYTGLQEGTGLVDYPHSIVGSPQGANYSVGLVYNQVPRNDAAKGRLQTQIALTRQSRVALSETARNAATSVVVAFAGVRSTVAQLQKSRDAVHFYRAALDGEREKYRLGLNSIVDVLTVEDRLTTATIAEVNARLAYALALVQMRQDTATIVQAGQDVQYVNPAVFSQIPDAGGTP